MSAPGLPPKPCPGCGGECALDWRGRWRRCWPYADWRLKRIRGAQAEMMARWEGLDRRVINSLAREVPDDEPSPIAWAEGLTDEQLLGVDNLGVTSLKRFRAVVPPPHPDRDPRAERAILSHDEAYRLVGEAREQRERAEALLGAGRIMADALGDLRFPRGMSFEFQERVIGALDGWRAVLARMEGE